MGILWDGIAALTYEAYHRKYALTSRKADTPEGYSAPAWEVLPDDEKEAWVAAAQVAADTFVRAALV